MLDVESRNAVFVPKQRRTWQRLRRHGQVHDGKTDEDHAEHDGAGREQSIGVHPPNLRGVGPLGNTVDSAALTHFECWRRTAGTPHWSCARCLCRGNRRSPLPLAAQPVRSYGWRGRREDQTTGGASHPPSSHARGFGRRQGAVTSVMGAIRSPPPTRASEEGTPASRHPDVHLAGVPTPILRAGRGDATALASVVRALPVWRHRQMVPLRHPPAQRTTPRRSLAPAIRQAAALASFRVVDSVKD
jgi:hypothetical protein